MIKMYPIEEPEDEVVSSGPQTCNTTKPPDLESSSSKNSVSNQNSEKPSALRPNSVSPTSSRNSVLGKVERPAIKIYGTLMVTTNFIIMKRLNQRHLQILILVATDDFFLLENSALTFTAILLVLLIVSVTIITVIIVLLRSSSFSRSACSLWTYTGSATRPRQPPQDQPLTPV